MEYLVVIAILVSIIAVSVAFNSHRELLKIKTECARVAIQCGDINDEVRKTIRYCSEKMSEADFYHKLRISKANEFYAARVFSAVEHYKKTLSETELICRKKTTEANNYYQSAINNANERAKSIIKSAEDEINIKWNNLRRYHEFVKRFIQSKISAFPEVAIAVADYQTAIDEYMARRLKAKSRPAPKAAEAIKMVKRENHELICRNKALEWEMKYLRRILPWLDEIEDKPMESREGGSLYENQNYNSGCLQDKDVDNAGYWLTPQEYQVLSVTERNQLALDRYKKRRKTNEEIGEAYERYIGYLFEKAGYTVEYTGIKNGLNDLGRDLICIYGNRIYVVQCKCWSNLQGKVIREKHINQLYGTTVMYVIEQRRKNPNQNVVLGWSDNLFDIQVIPKFISTVPFSDVAKDFAEALNIELQQEPFGDYPMIKCNINAGKKIYHLPFDQQYDKTRISKPGEFYAMTVAEAENKGFRRAKKWIGNL